MIKHQISSSLRAVPMAVLLFSGGCSAVSNTSMTANTLTTRWQTETAVERLTDKPNFFMQLSATEASTTPITGGPVPGRAMLMIACKDGAPLPSIGWNTIVGGPRIATVDYRFDKLPAQRPNPTFNGFDSFSLSGEDARIFLEQLASSQQLYVSVRATNGVGGSADFNIVGAQEPLGTLYQHCPLRRQGESQAGPSRKK
jgi:hypothetical protein